MIDDRSNDELGLFRRWVILDVLIFWIHYYSAGRMRSSGGTWAVSWRSLVYREQSFMKMFFRHFKRKTGKAVSCTSWLGTLAVSDSDHSTRVSLNRCRFGRTENGWISLSDVIWSVLHLLKCVDSETDRSRVVIIKPALQVFTFAYLKIPSALI